MCVPSGGCSEGKESRLYIKLDINIFERVSADSALSLSLGGTVKCRHLLLPPLCVISSCGLSRRIYLGCRGRDKSAWQLKLTPKWRRWRNSADWTRLCSLARTVWPKGQRIAHRDNLFIFAFAFCPAGDANPARAKASPKQSRRAFSPALRLLLLLLAVVMYIYLKSEHTARALHYYVPNANVAAACRGTRVIPLLALPPECVRR